MTTVSGTLPGPAGPYSHVARVGNTLYSAGQSGADTGGVLPDGITAQSEQCYRNILTALAAGGASEKDVVKVTVYLTAVEHFETMNAAYAAAFTSPYPARTTVYVTLPPGMLIEADAIAMTQETAE